LGTPDDKPGPSQVELNMYSGENMLGFGLGLLVGVIACVLVYRNNKVKFAAAVEVAVAAALAAKAKVQ
jgi:hypothetical protein